MLTGGVSGFEKGLGTGSYMVLTPFLFFIWLLNALLTF